MRRARLTERKCLQCGKTFLAENGEINRGNGNYCSRGCATSARTGSASNGWRGGMVALVCLTCGKTFDAYPSAVKRGRRYCSKPCQAVSRIGSKHSAETKRKMSENQKGEKNHSWQGGVTHNGGGYVLIKMPNHPFCNNHGYVGEHRLAMEKARGRYLEPFEVVHHMDGNTSNNTLSNLMLFPDNVSHLAYHRRFGTIKQDGVWAP